MQVFYLKSHRKEGRQAGLTGSSSVLPSPGYCDRCPKGKLARGPTCRATYLAWTFIHGRKIFVPWGIRTPAVRGPKVGKAISFHQKCLSPFSNSTVEYIGLAHCFEHPLHAGTTPGLRQSKHRCHQEQSKHEHCSERQVYPEEGRQGHRVA